MIPRNDLLLRLKQGLERSPVTSLLGPRQSGKTTLAREVCGFNKAVFFDLESVVDRNRLANPELTLSQIDEVIVLDEIQEMPELFALLRVLVDRSRRRRRFLILGSASPVIIRNVSESLAGRVEFVEISGFNVKEVGVEKWWNLWLRGGFPLSFLGNSNEESFAWRDAFIQTFLQRDIPQLGITIPWVTMRRFWTMLAHYHGRTWNASRIAQSMGVSGKTVRSYLDILTGTFMIRQLQPWHENLRKRQVKAPKIYFRDTGILHALLGVKDREILLGHPVVGPSWEGFAIEQILQIKRPDEVYFWATHTGAELDLLLFCNGKKFGIEVKWSQAPVVTKSMHTALADLHLETLWIIYPGEDVYPMGEKITAWPLKRLEDLPLPS